MAGRGETALARLPVVIFDNSIGLSSTQDADFQ